MRDNCVDFGNLIITANEAWSSTHDAEVEACAKTGQPAPIEIIKIVFFCDAETAIGKWKKLITPDEVGNYHLSAKLIRIAGYCQDVAVMAYILHKVIWQSGSEISLPHLMSHVSDAIEERKFIEAAELHNSLKQKSLPVVAATLRSFHVVPSIPDPKKWPAEMQSS